MSDCSSSIVLPTTLYGEDVVVGCGAGTGVAGIVAVEVHATLKLAIEHTCAGVSPDRSGEAASCDAVASTLVRSAAEVAVVTRWPSTTKCSSDLAWPGASVSEFT